MLTGDLEPKGWQQLQSNNQKLQCDVLKFPHHGGAWSEIETNELLDQVNPSIVVISVGTDGKKYKHPNTEVFASLHKRPSIRVLCTQATDQCRQSVLAVRDSVAEQFKFQAARNGNRIMLAQHGCPCAGTVIVELGEQVRVLQPDLHFHRNVIIETFFKEDHKCNLSPLTEPPTDLTEAAQPL